MASMTWIWYIWLLQKVRYTDTPLGFDSNWWILEDADHIFRHLYPILWPFLGGATRLDRQDPAWCDQLQRHHHDMWTPPLATSTANLTFDARWERGRTGLSLGMTGWPKYNPRWPSTGMINKTLNNPQELDEKNDGRTTLKGPTFTGQASRKVPTLKRTWWVAAAAKGVDGNEHWGEAVDETVDLPGEFRLTL